MPTDITPDLVSVRDLARPFRGMILDIFGVLHNGVCVYPGVVETLMKLRTAGTRVCLLSNSPRRAAALTERLNEMGLHRDLYAGLISSGEMVFSALSRTMRIAGMPDGLRYLYAGPVDLEELLKGLPHQRVGNPVEADFILATGEVAHDEAWLRELWKCGLPMICANPDIDVIVGSQRVACAGSLARRYEAIGGDVIRVGKPGMEAYVAALKFLDVQKSDVVAVGDSLATDIAGANGTEIPSALVLLGVHHDELFDRSAADVTELETLYHRYNARPDYLLKQFAWD
jgi:HAD superfamily hydrolase (TIGR01459 family)